MSTQTSNSLKGRSKASEQRRAQICTLIDEMGVLPTSMVVPMQVLRLQRSSSASLAEYAEAVSRDAALTARVLGIVNSASFSPVQPITRLSQAVPMIGLKNLMPLVFSFSLGGIFNKLAMPAEERAASFRSAMLKAFFAREVVLAMAGEQHEEAFLCALMLDIGLPLLFSADRGSWMETLPVLDIQDCKARREREERSFGIDHASVGGLVAQRMGLPKTFCDAIGRHHDGSGALVEVLGPAFGHAVDVAASVPHRFSSPSQALQLPASRLRTVPGLTQGLNATELLRRVVNDYSAALKILGSDDDTGVAFKDFLQEISALVAASVSGAVETSQSVISGLKVRETGLVQQLDGLRQQIQASELDGLTNVLNRAAFMKRMPTLLNGAAKHNFACAIGYVDVDNFKSLNDAHGHAAGDAALQQVAAQLSEIVQRRGHVGRVGGDEFVFVLLSRRPFTKEEVDAEFGTKMCHLSVSTPTGAWDFSTSVGLLDIGVPTPNASVDQLFKWADELMYGVKKTGKGRCLFGSRAAVGVP